jgi:3-oxoacyl-[acyl-carrier-protein] synthase-1
MIHIGMTSAVGLSAAQTAAAMRAGISGYRATSILDVDEERITMAVVPETDLPELSPNLANAGLSGRKTRLLRLATLALPECLSTEHRVE